MPSQDSARAGGGEEAVRGEIDWELKLSEQRELPAAARQRLSAASGGSRG